MLDDSQEIGKATDFRDGEISTLFHEFMHHMQNNSTIIGLSYRNLNISLWHSSRNYRANNDDIESLNQAKIALAHIRVWNINNQEYSKTLPIFISEIDSVDVESDDQNPIKLKITDNVSDESIDIKFGIAEFMESSAYILEKYFCKKLNIEFQDNSVPSIPYKIGEAIGNHYNNSISEVRTIIILLAALQHANPHKVYIALLKQIANIKITDLEVIGILKNYCKEQVIINKNFIDDVKRQFNDGFPGSDPSLGDIAKSIINKIIKNINAREIDPFPEFEFLSKINRTNLKENFDELVRTFGSCMIIRSRQDVEDDTPEKDICMFLGRGDEGSPSQREWEIFQSAMHFTIHHLNNREQSPFADKKAECLSYSYCSNKNRKSNGDICKMRPWSHPAPVMDGSDCPYQIAVFKTNLRNFKIESTIISTNP